jgi:hypothetical protein
VCLEGVCTVELINILLKVVHKVSEHVTSLKMTTTRSNLNFNNFKKQLIFVDGNQDPSLRGHRPGGIDPQRNKEACLKK